mmetsp:Transcript_6455/g.9238  ORF Transcript_6455/g.9238 Transcript_6455/m.9238 type:complete len:204 (+) Transcript_6455:32-643(+)
MSAFPYTAPRFTEEERQKEIALLSDEERELINQELNGSDILKENEDETELYINRMEKELEKIPLEEKTEYEEALINAPELVKSESGFLRFLRKHNYDTAAAAHNLVSYWAYRVKVFGRDKAFLPMTISGAMRDDFEALATGFIQIIGTDAHGRAILYHEKKRTDPQLHHRSSLWKSVFYILHVASSNSEIQKKRCSLHYQFWT